MDSLLISEIVQGNFDLTYSIFVQGKEVIPPLLPQPSCGGVLDDLCDTII